MIFDLRLCYVKHLMIKQYVCYEVPGQRPLWNNAQWLWDQILYFELLWLHRHKQRSLPLQNMQLLSQPVCSPRENSNIAALALFKTINTLLHLYTRDTQEVEAPFPFGTDADQLGCSDRAEISSWLVICSDLAFSPWVASCLYSALCVIRKEQRRRRPSGESCIKCEQPGCSCVFLALVSITEINNDSMKW